MIKRLPAICIIFFLQLMIPSDGADPIRGVQDVVFLSSEEYLPVLLESIRGARHDIHIEMYLIRPGQTDDHPVNTILSELAAARKRGVQVKVLMDSHFAGDNQKAEEKMKAGGVWDVSYEEETVTNHTKLVMIDDEILLAGSQNWTLSALAASHESAVFIKDARVVAELKKELKRDGARCNGLFSHA